MLTDAQKELCEKLDAPSYTADDYMTMAEAANEIRYMSGLRHIESTEPDREQVGEAKARCQYCDGTGDVHDFSGVWLGECLECNADASPSRECGERQAASAPTLGESHSWDEEGDHCTKCGDPAWCADKVCKPNAASTPTLTIDERAEFLAYWCEDVPDYMREKWKENVDQCIKDGNATEKLSAAWDAWQARALLANGE